MVLKSVVRRISSPATGALLVAAAMLAACGPGPEEVRATVVYRVAAAAEATDEARPTSTPFATATNYAAATLYPTRPMLDTATPYPTEPPYLTATAYPTHTPLPTPTATETPRPLPTAAVAAIPAPRVETANVEIDILRLLQTANQDKTLILATLGQQPDCQTLVGAFERLTQSPALDVSGALVNVQGAHQVYLDSAEYFRGPNSISDMIDQCRAFLAEGRAKGQFSKEFFWAAQGYVLFSPNVGQALKEIGGE